LPLRGQRYTLLHIGNFLFEKLKFVNLARGFQPFLPSIQVFLAYQRRSGLRLASILPRFMPSEAHYPQLTAVPLSSKIYCDELRSLSFRIPLFICYENHCTPE
jgi:hypothetical protein